MEKRFFLCMFARRANIHKKKEKYLAAAGTNTYVTVRTPWCVLHNTEYALRSPYLHAWRFHRTLRPAMNRMFTGRAAPQNRHGASWPALLVALLAGIALRWLLWDSLPRNGFVSDEGEYLSAASWLAQGRGFAWYLHYLWTRAPLYPLFVAVHLRLFGDALEPVYLTQNALSLLNVVLVYALARRVSGWPVAFLAALLTALYLPFAIYTQTLLSETLFITLLLAGFWLLALWASPPLFHGRTLLVLLAGVLFGLATLVRSLMLAFLPLALAWLLFVAWRSGKGSIRYLLMFVLAAALVIGPWSWYNSRVYGGLVVIDTSGAFNLMLGGRTAYDGNARYDAPSRNFVLALVDDELVPEQRRALLEPIRAADGSLLSDGPCLLRRGDGQLEAALAQGKGQSLPQAQVQQLMTAEGLCLISAKPWAFVAKSAAELADLFTINYSGDERFTDGFAVGQVPTWYAWALLLLDDILYVVMLALAPFGWALLLRRNPLARPLLALIGLWFAYNMLAAPLLFAINRFRLPLMPFVFLLAAYAVQNIGVGWRLVRWPAKLGATVVALLLFGLAATPQAYLLPLDVRGNSPYASLLGPYPSSVEATRLALASRPAFLFNQQVQAALHRGDATEAQSLLNTGQATRTAAALGPALLAGLEGNPSEGLMLITGTTSVQQTVVAADLLRSSGEIAKARRLFSDVQVDNANPVQFAWDWLYPTSTLDIDLAGNLDLGYIEGCYLGEGDTTISPPANFRWCSDGARLRFPRGGTGAAQTLWLRADGRGWPRDMLPLAPVEVWMNGAPVGSFTPDADQVNVFEVALPPTPPGQDVLITLHTPTFVPDAARYLSQQGILVGQVQRLGVRLDEVRLENP